MHVEECTTCGGCGMVMDWGGPTECANCFRGQSVNGTPDELELVYHLWKDHWHNRAPRDEGTVMTTIADTVNMLLH